MIGALIGGAMGALGGLLGGLGKNKALREQQRMLEKQQRDNQNWYDRRYNEDATQRADAQRMLTLTEENLRRRNRAAAGAAAVMGGTEESVAATKEANAKAMADATSQIAAAGEARKDSIEDKYLTRKENLANQMMNVQGQKQSGWDLASNAIGGATNGVGMGSNYDLAKQYIDKM